MVANKTEEDATLMNIEIADEDGNTHPIAKMETSNYVTHRIYHNRVESEDADGTQTKEVTEFGVIDVSLPAEEFAQYRSEFREYLQNVLTGDVNAEVQQIAEGTLEVTDGEGVTLTVRAHTE